MKILPSEVLKGLTPPIQQRVEEEINKILKNPTQGKLLICNLRGYCSWSFGDYRILYKISEEYVTIHLVSHRKDVYKIAARLLQLILSL